MKDAIATIVVAIVLAVLFMYVLLSWAFSGWGDPSRPSPSPSAITSCCSYPVASTRT